MKHPLDELMELYRIWIYWHKEVRMITLKTHRNRVNAEQAKRVARMEELKESIKGAMVDVREDT
jgi:hypothetical protein